MKKFQKFMSGKGYYIALVLCAVAIGISGYLYYRNANEQTPGDKDISLSATEQDNKEDLAVVGTQPVIGTKDDETPSSGNEPSVVTKPLQTASPVEGQTVVVYAMDHLGYNPTTRDWRTHNGIDIAAEPGTAVCAAAAGTVYTVYTDDTMGTTVVVRHAGGYVTTYSSLDEKLAVAAGDPVELGQKLGTVGTSALLENAIGEHVHFSVTCNDEPVDPAQFLGQ